VRGEGNSILLYSIDNNYLSNTADYFDFWKLKSTMCGIGALILNVNFFICPPSIDFGFTRSKVKVTRVTLVKKMVSTHYLENYLLQSFHISHAD